MSVDLTKAIDCLEAADRLLAEVGRNPQSVAFQQSGVAQAADLVREAIFQVAGEALNEAVR